MAAWFPALLTLSLLFLKAFGVISVSWWVVFAPVLAAVVLGLAVFVAFLWFGDKVSRDF